MVCYLMMIRWCICLDLVKYYPDPGHLPRAVVCLYFCVVAVATEQIPAHSLSDVCERHCPRLNI